MTFNTGNPIGSTDARDLSDNAENFDKAINSIESTWNDRLGVTRDTFEGALSKLSFYRVGTFAEGYTLTNMRQTLEYSGHEYSWAGTFPKVVAAGSTPATSGGMGAGAWVDRTDLMLRNELALKDGEKLVGMCEDLTSLRATEPTFDGQTINLKQHTAGTFKGGGRFRALLNGASYTDNNGTIIKTTGGAVWLRINSDILTPIMFGALGDGNTDDTSALNSCFGSGESKDVDLLGKTYGVNSTVYFNGARPRVFTNGVISALSASITITRIYSYGHTLNKIKIQGNNLDGTYGVIVDSKASGFKFIDGEIVNTGASAIVLNASNSIIGRNYFANCGNGASTVGNFRATIYANAVSNCEVSSNVAIQCRWGFIFREESVKAAQPNNRYLYNRISGAGGLGELDSQGLSHQNQSGLKIIGNTVSNFGNNGIDLQQCVDSVVFGNNVTACADGVFIGDRSCQGHRILSNVIDGCEKGIRYYNTSSYPNMTFTGIDISGNYIKNCTAEAIFVSLTEATSVNRLCNIDNNLVYLCTGIRVTGLTGGSVSGNKTYRTRLEGIYLNNTKYVMVDANSVQDAGYGSGTYGAIKIEGSSAERNFIRDNYLFGTATYGVIIATGVTATVCTGNRGRSLATGILSDSGTGTITTVSNSTV